jgi:ABC-type transporter Mla MlaB component
MKKLTAKQRIHLLSRARNEAQKKRRLNRDPNSKPFILNAVFARQTPQTPREKKVFSAPAPENFNLRHENCEQVIQYINDIKRSAVKKWNIVIDLSKVKDLKEGAIAMLLSVVTEIKGMKKVSVSGIAPTDRALRTILEKSNFFENVPVKGQPAITTIRDFLRSGKKGDPRNFLAEQIRKAMEVVWNQSGRNPNLRTVIFEMMRNSCDHAFQNKKDVRWHLSISHDQLNNLVKFSFVDNGEGIPRTLVKNYLTSIKAMFKGDAEMLEAAYHGESKSRTQLPWRGKGLPTIYENSTDKHIKNFLVISNGVFLHFDSQRRENLKVPFRGTYYYWEIDKSCIKTCFPDENN